MTTAVDVKEGAATQPDQQTPPCAMVIFGGSGDLTKRKLIPALYNLLTSRLLRKEFAVVAIARSDISTDDFRARLEEEAREFLPEPIDPAVWSQLRQAIHYMPGEFANPATY